MDMSTPLLNFVRGKEDEGKRKGKERERGKGEGDGGKRNREGREGKEKRKGKDKVLTVMKMSYFRPCTFARGVPGIHAYPLSFFFGGEGWR